MGCIVSKHEGSSNMSTSHRSSANSASSVIVIDGAVLDNGNNMGAMTEVSHFASESSNSANNHSTLEDLRKESLGGAVLALQHFEEEGRCMSNPSLRIHPSSVEGGGGRGGGGGVHELQFSFVQGTLSATSSRTTRTSTMHPAASSSGNSSDPRLHSHLSSWSRSIVSFQGREAEQCARATMVDLNGE